MSEQTEAISIRFQGPQVFNSLKSKIQQIIPCLSLNLELDRFS